MILCLCFLVRSPVFFLCFCTSGSYRQQLDIQTAQVNYMEVSRANFNTLTLRFSQQLLQTENIWNVMPCHWVSRSDDKALHPGRWESQLHLIEMYSKQHIFKACNKQPGSLCPTSDNLTNLCPLSVVQQHSVLQYSGEILPQLN